MDINFVLPGYVQSPCGGFKVIYELASRLAQRGHRSRILHPRSLQPARGPWRTVRSRTWPARVGWKQRLGRDSLVPWFEFHPSVSLRLVPDLSEAYVPDADISIATAWRTAAPVAKLGVAKGKKILYVQDYEHWVTADGATRDAMSRAFRGPFDLVASSPPVGDVLRSQDLTPEAEVTPGLDERTFGLDRPPSERDPHVVGFPYRTESFKGTLDALEALGRFRQRAGSPIRVRAFGTLPAPDLPEWVEYLHLPSDSELRAFYNDVAVFLLPSHHEGWGLPALEAMACGAALVAADCVGPRSFAHHDVTALLVATHRPDLLATALERLVTDRSLRLRLTENGRRVAREYRWAPTVDAIEEMMLRGTTADA